MLLSLTQDGTELQFKLALHLHLFHSLGDADVLEEVRLFNHRDGFFQVDYTLFKHPKLLKAHCQVVVGDVREVLVSLAVLQVNYLKHTLCLLKKDIRFLILVFLYEFVSYISQLHQKERDLVLIYLDLFVI